jgi:hypothetical protein
MDYGHKSVPYLREATPSDFVHNYSVENIEYMVLPAGLLESLNKSGYGAFTSLLDDWSTVYELHHLPQREPGLKTEILGYLGISLKGEYHYVVLENPRRKG